MTSLALVRRIWTANPFDEPPRKKTGWRAWTGKWWVQVPIILPVVLVVKYGWPWHPLILWMTVVAVGFPFLLWLLLRWRRARYGTALVLVGAVLNAAVVLGNGGKMPVAGIASEDPGIHWQAMNESTRLPWLGDVIWDSASIGDVFVTIGLILALLLAPKDRGRAVLLSLAVLLGLAVTLIGIAAVRGYVDGRLGSLLPSDSVRLAFAGMAALTWAFACVGIFASYRWLRRNRQA